MYSLRPPRFDQLMRYAAIGTRDAYLEHARKSTGPMEDWHVVGAPDEAPFDPDWKTFGEPYVVQYRKDNEGFVYLTGRARWFRNYPSLRNRNWAYNFGPIFTLPPGYQPQYRAYIGIACRWEALDYSYPGGLERTEVPVNVAADVVVEPNGRVRPIFVREGSDGSVITVRLDNLAFRAAAPVL